jgi:hypothetical protein
MLKTLVAQREFIVKNNISLKNRLHSLLTLHYPDYRSFFPNIDAKSALTFFHQYPSPSTLKGTTVEQLADSFADRKRGYRHERAKKIIDSLQETAVQFQEFRDETVRSTVRQIEYNLLEIRRLETTLSDIMGIFGTTLTSMKYIDTVSAAQMLSHGNRELNSLFYRLAQRLTMTVGPTKKIINPFLYEYYTKKLSEGKTKRQAHKCVQRRLVNIIWGMPRLPHE